MCLLFGMFACWTFKKCLRWTLTQIKIIKICTMFQIMKCYYSLMIHPLKQTFTWIALSTLWSTLHLYAFYPIISDWCVIWKHLLLPSENGSGVTFDPHCKRALHPEGNLGPSFFFFHSFFNRKPPPPVKLLDAVLCCNVSHEPTHFLLA